MTNNKVEIIYFIYVSRSVILSLNVIDNSYLFKIFGGVWIFFSNFACPAVVLKLYLFLQNVCQHTLFICISVFHWLCYFVILTVNVDINDYLHWLFFIEFIKLCRTVRPVIYREKELKQLLKFEYSSTNFVFIIICYI